MQWWRVKALALQQHQTRTWMKYWNSLKEDVLRECAPKCFAKEILEVDCKSRVMSEMQGAFVCGSRLCFNLSLNVQILIDRIKQCSRLDLSRPPPF